MSAADRISDEINRLLDHLADDEETWEPRWVAHSLVEKYDDGYNDLPYEEETRHAMYRYCREQVRRIIARRTDPTEQSGSDEQPTLPGFDHVRHYYDVEREGGIVGVPVTEMSDSEIDGKAEEYRRMGDALYAHADELERFKRERRNDVA